MFSRARERLRRTRPESPPPPERKHDRKRPSRKAEHGTSSSSHNTIPVPSIPIRRKSSSKRERHGLFVLHPGKGSHIKADIIALHGLGGHPYKSFTDAAGHMWLRDSLPDHVPGVRVCTFGYESETWSGSKSTILEFALDLLERIRILRQTQDERSRPIIFICHSFGGLVGKKALIVAHEQPQYSVILKSIQGILFMGTPHRGSKLAGLAGPLANIINLALVKKKIRSDLINNLEIPSTTITEITVSGVHRLARLEIVSFYEQKVMGPLGCRVVEPFSAILGLPNERALPIAADHSTMVQLSPSEKEKYRPVWTAIAEIVTNSRAPAEDMQFNISSKSSDWDEAREMLDTLYCVDYSRFLLDAPNAHPGTCSWILEDRIFTEWLTAPQSGILHLHAHPGRGKTVLARFLVETLKSPPQMYPGIHGVKSFKVAHYFILEQDETRGSEAAILRSLLHQFVLEDPSVCHIIQHYFDLERRIKIPEEDSQTLWKAIEGVLELDKMKKAIIVMDALDELGYSSLNAVLGGLALMIKGIRDRRSDRTLKIIITSRPNESIHQILTKAHPLKMKVRSQDDVHSFVRSEVTDFSDRHSFPHDVTSNIILEITTKADGMFLWASLAWTNFKEGVTIWNNTTIKRQLRSLQDLPPGLTSLYKTLLTKMDFSQFRELKPLFECILVARSPLTCEEMAEALATPGCKRHSDLETAFSIARTVEVTCPNFVQVDLNGTLRFVHQSIKDFFKDGHSNLSLQDAHYSMARTCLAYLRFQDVPEPLELGAWEIGPRYAGASHEKFQLLDYASSNLWFHMEQVHTEEDTWVDFYNLILENKCDVENPYHRKPLRLAVMKDSRVLFQRFLEAGADIDERFRHPDGDGGTSLHFCIHKAKVEMAKYLLTNGASPNIQDYYKRTPLHLAIRDQHDELIEIIMAREDVDLNARDSDGRTILHWAVMGISVDLLDTLLKDPRLEVNVVDNDKRTALTYAAYWGHENGVKYILNNSTSLQQHREEDLSPVICAAQQGWRALTLELIGRLTNINQHRGSDRKSIVHWAAIHDWEEIIEAAVEKAGAKLNHIDSSGKTPLHYAAGLGNFAATKRLVRCGASVRISDNAGMTAVQVAAMEGFSDTLNLMLQTSDYDINERDNQGCTLLHWAASWDWVSVMRVVVDHPDVELFRRNGYGRTALHISALCGCPNVMKFLLDLNFYDINQADGFGNTLLHLGSRIGSANVVRHVLGLRLFDKNRLNDFGQTARNCAVVYHKYEIGDMLEDAGVRLAWMPIPVFPAYSWQTYISVPLPQEEDLFKALVTSKQAEEFREADDPYKERERREEELWELEEDMQRWRHRNS